MKMHCTGGHTSGVVNSGDFTYQDWPPEKLIFKCPLRKGTCSIPIHQGPPVEDGEKRVFGWDGNRESPSITPSINCDHEKRCGWHGHIVGGTMIGVDREGRPVE